MPRHGAILAMDAYAILEDRQTGKRYNRRVSVEANEDAASVLIDPLVAGVDAEVVWITDAAMIRTLLLLYLANQRLESRIRQAPKARRQKERRAERERNSRLSPTCPECEGRGEADINDRLVPCPRCA